MRVEGLAQCVLLFAILGEAVAAAPVWYDLDRDGTVEYVSFTYKQVVNGHPMGGDIVVSHKINGKLKVIWRHGGLNPWKVEIGDVDGDGKAEVIAGVWKKSRYDPVFAKRTFVYSWNGKRLLPKWLGSRLSRRFTDFTVCELDKDGKVELIALEEAPRGAKYVTVYRWRAFGFEWVGRTGPIDGSAVRTENKSVIVLTKSGPYALVMLSGKPALRKLSGGGNEKGNRK